MRKKEPETFGKLNVKRGVKAVLVVETAVFFGLYYYWHKMNTSRGNTNAADTGTCALLITK